MAEGRRSVEADHTEYLGEGSGGWRVRREYTADDRLADYGRRQTEEADYGSSRR